TLRDSLAVMPLLLMNMMKMEHVLSIKAQAQAQILRPFIKVVTIILKLGNLTD
ncbi:hypothetical protein DBR06_SOUSAS2910027, partial [Sousa chinensis]